MWVQGSRRISFQPAATERKRPRESSVSSGYCRKKNRSILPTCGRSLSRGTRSSHPEVNPVSSSSRRDRSSVPGCTPPPAPPRGRACSSSISEGPHLQSSQVRSPQLPTHLQDELGPWRSPGVPEAEAASRLSPGGGLRLRAAGPPRFPQARLVVPRPRIRVLPTTVSRLELESASGLRSRCSRWNPVS